jgi:hypothetical protein
VNAPASKWRPGSDPPGGWERDPSDSRAIRTVRGEVSPGCVALVQIYHQRAFYWEGLSAAQPHAESLAAAAAGPRGRVVTPAVEGAGDELEARATRTGMRASDRNWMSLSAWFHCHEQGAPALNWERCGGPFYPGDPCILEIRNNGKRAHSYAITLQGIEDVGGRDDNGPRGADGSP